MEFNIFDVVVIIITLILAIKGFFSGIIKEIAGLIGIGLGIFLGTLYYKQAGEFINLHILKIQNDSAINIVGFVGVFIAVWGIIIFFGWILSKLLKVSHLGFLDRIGGVVFSAGKFFVIVSVIVTMLSQIEALKSTLSKYQKNSIMWPIMNSVGQTLVHLKPEDVKKQIDDIKKKVNDKIGEDIKKQVEETKAKIADTVAKQVEKAKGE